MSFADCLVVGSLVSVVAFFVGMVLLMRSEDF